MHFNIWITNYNKIAKSINLAIFNIIIQALTMGGCKGGSQSS